ncbi:MAG TPA: hypothetical protein VMM84_14970 [Pyrinomonadaceae bacterium]|nr:hypothetical protein [Pyrinomonadaceae bacterium]
MEKTRFVCLTTFVCDKMQAGYCLDRMFDVKAGQQGEEKTDRHVLQRMILKNGGAVWTRDVRKGMSRSLTIYIEQEIGIPKEEAEQAAAIGDPAALMIGGKPYLPQVADYLVSRNYEEYHRAPVIVFQNRH